jgi:hypothetical protein
LHDARDDAQWRIVTVWESAEAMRVSEPVPRGPAPLRVAGSAFEVVGQAHAR